MSFSGNQNDMVEGMVFELTSAELAQADNYEVDDYQRKWVLFKSGDYAWAYVAKDLQAEKPFEQ